MKTVLFLLLGIILFFSTIIPQSHNEGLKNQAYELMNMKRFGEAIDLLHRFIAANPQNIEGYIMRGTCYEMRGEFELAVYDYRTAKKIAPANKEIDQKLSLTTESWKKLLLNKIEGHKREIAIHPDRPDNYLAIGIAYKNLGEWKEAEIWYDEYISRSGISSDELLRYTEILAKNNQLAKGEKILKNHISKFADDHRIWSRYGYFLYWLGKFNSAVSSFEESLRIRPFFKEALDGLDLAKGKGYLYTINDTTVRYQYGLSSSAPGYLIDRLFRMIKADPDDDKSRFQLIDELVKVNRFEEAYEQLKILASKYKDSEEFNSLYTRVMEYRKAYYKSTIDSCKRILSSNPDDTDAIMTLAKYYSYQGAFSESREMYERYLKINPKDLDARYSYAELLSWSDDLCTAGEEAELLLAKEPENLKYQLLSANIKFWMNKDIEESQRLYGKVLSKEPENKIAMMGLLNISLRLDKPDEAVSILNKMIEYKILSENEVDKINADIEVTRDRIKESGLYAYLEKARSFMSEGECYMAIDYFEKYFREGGKSAEVNFELADAYQCVRNFRKAIENYDKLIEAGFNDYETKKHRAKIIFWSGDSLSALRELRKMLELDPADAEIKLYLGDTYVSLKKFKTAREIYSELLMKSPGSHILKERMNWLGNDESLSFSVSSFPTYVMISPQVNYFSDNTDFKYNIAGLGVELGIARSVSIGISGYRGSLTSDATKLNFNNLKGSVSIRLSENVRASGSAGQTYFSDDLKENIFEGSLNFNKKDIYSASIFYYNMDAAFILYSPFLVSNRLTSEMAGINGEYQFPNSLILSGKFFVMSVSDGNEGSQLAFRLGKKFDQYIKGGYEYYYYSFSDLTQLYWSPDNFEAHSLWGDFSLLNNLESELTIGGKLGLIPENDFLLKEFFGEFKYKFSAGINLQAKVTAGSSSRAGVGYNSTSFQLGIFWTL